MRRRLRLAAKESRQIHRVTRTRDAGEEIVNQATVLEASLIVLAYQAFRGPCRYAHAARQPDCDRPCPLRGDFEQAGEMNLPRQRPLLIWAAAFAAGIGLGALAGCRRWPRCAWRHLV